jgi:hypothetical protein
MSQPVRFTRQATIVLEGRARAGADEADVDGGEVVHAPDEGDATTRRHLGVQS